MKDHSPRTDQFKQRLRRSLNQDRERFATFELEVNEKVFACGDTVTDVFIIESGQVKMISLSPSGKECLLAIYGAGDVFGETSLKRSSESQMTATAMAATRLWRIPGSEFASHLDRESLTEGFLGYLVERLSSHRKVITSFVTTDSERRLGMTLLRLGTTVGTKHEETVRINCRITHEELSIMVGTTRPWISKFMKRFERHDLIVIGPDRHITINAKKLQAFVN